MSEMITISVEVEVPIEKLRKEEFFHTADDCRKYAEEAEDLLWKVSYTASAALIEAQDDLRSRNTPVTKDTKWCALIVNTYDGTLATFIGPYPNDPRRFIGLTNGSSCILWCESWFEAPDVEKEPIEVGQKRLVPAIIEQVNESGYSDIEFPDGSGDSFPNELVEQWEVVK